jgi:hypothetical protein
MLVAAKYELAAADQIRFPFPPLIYGPFFNNLKIHVKPIRA